MANVTLPAPVLLAGGAICLVGGYLIGAVAGPDAPDSTTASVVSYQRDGSRLCLSGDAVEDQQGAKDGELCGVWRRSNPSAGDDPAKGDSFRFVSLISQDDAERADPTTVIYGDLVG